jgi:hypothetical protein
MNSEMKENDKERIELLKMEIEETKGEENKEPENKEPENKEPENKEPDNKEEIKEEVSVIVEESDIEPIDKLLNETNKLLNKSQIINKPFVQTIELETNKQKLVIYLQGKIDKLTQRIRLVEHKYSKYKKTADAVNIGIIMLSTILTLIESSKTEFVDYNTNTFFNLCPVFISTTITCSAAILKFKKFQEKMEGISKVVDKCIFAIARIRKCQEDILFLSSPEEFEEVKLRYHKDIYEYYNACNQDIEQFLKIEDYGRYLKSLNDIDINIMILEKDKLKKERFIERDFSHYMETLEQKKKKRLKIKQSTCNKCTIC